MLVRVFLVTTLALAAVLAVKETDDVCYDLDSVIEEKVFSQIRNYFVSTSSDYVNLRSNYEFSLLGYGAGIAGGRLGNISEFSLDVVDGYNSSTLCLNKASGEEFVTAHLTFDHFDLVFDNFYIHVPLFGIGDTKTTFSLKGVKILSRVQLYEDEKDVKCDSAELVYFGLREFGKLHIDFESGLMNKLYSYILNYWSDQIVSALSYTGVGRWIESEAKIFLQPAVQKLETYFCSLEPQTYK